MSRCKNGVASGTFVLVNTFDSGLNYEALYCDGELIATGDPLTAEDVLRALTLTPANIIEMDLSGADEVKFPKKLIDVKKVG